MARMKGCHAVSFVVTSMVESELELYDGGGTYRKRITGIRAISAKTSRDARQWHDATTPRPRAHGRGASETQVQRGKRRKWPALGGRAHHVFNIVHTIIRIIISSRGIVLYPGCTFH